MPRKNSVMLARAAQIDAGFDVGVLADMIATLDRFTGGEIPGARRLVRSRAASVLCDLAIRTDSVGRIS